MPRKLFRKYLPTPEALLERRWAAPFRPWLAHANLWHLNRRSVPLAVAVGLFCGLIPGPFQMLGALLLAIPLRCNVPVALVVTLYTNPLTIVPLYLLAYAYGKAVRGDGDAAPHATPYQWDWSLTALWHWMLSLGKPLGVGLLALAFTLAIAGYVVARLGWRLHVMLAWRRRLSVRTGCAAGRRAARESARRARPGRHRG